MAMALINSVINYHFLTVGFGMLWRSWFRFHWVIDSSTSILSHRGFILYCELHFLYVTIYDYILHHIDMNTSRYIMNSPFTSHILWEFKSLLTWHTKSWWSLWIQMVIFQFANCKRLPEGISINIPALSHDHFYKTIGKTIVNPWKTSAKHSFPIGNIVNP